MTGPATLRHQRSDDGGAGFGRELELQQVIADIGRRLTTIGRVRTREHDDHLDVIEAAAAPYALAEFMEKSGIDFSQFATVEAIAKYLTEYFAALPRRGRFPLLDSGTFDLFDTKREDKAQGDEAQRDRREPREVDVLVIR